MQHARRVNPLLADDAVDEKRRVFDLERGCAERAQAHHPQLAIAKDDGFRRSPFLVEELAHVDEHNLSRKRRFAHRRQADDAGEDWDICSGNRVPARPKHVERFAIAEKDGGLALADDHLRPKPEIAGAAFRFAMNDLIAGVVEKLYDINDARHSSLLWRYQVDRYTGRQVYR